MPTSNDGAGDLVEVRRSRRRKSTVSAYRDGKKTVISIPARFSRAQEHEWVAKMIGKLEEKERRRAPSDDELLTRALDLNRKYLGGRATPASVRWVTNQDRRWGSCTMPDRTIRISSRVRGLPSWVLDYVLLHELSHILVSGHGPEFWALVDSYPRTERARGFLDGIAFAQDHPDYNEGDPQPLADDYSAQ